MYTATRIDTPDREQYRFRSLAALSRRLGGDGNYQVDHSSDFKPPTRQVKLLRADRRVNGFHVVATVSVPARAVHDMRNDQNGDHV